MERFQKTGQPVDFKMTFVLKLIMEVSCLIYGNDGAMNNNTKMNCL